jgi:hypothetical protein
MTLCLSQRHLIIVGKRKQQFIVSYYDLEPILAAIRQEISEEEYILGEPILKYETRKIPDFPDFNVSIAEVYSHLPSISVLSFNSQAAFQNRNNMVNLFWFQPSAVPEQQVRELRFTQRRSAVQEIVNLGKSGRRAVWVQRMWATDAFELMKGSFAHGKVVVGDLFASRLALPFEISAVQTITFDEATGKVGLGLHTGEIYLFQL